MHLNVRLNQWGGSGMAGKASSFFKLIDLMLKGAGKVIDDIISVFAKKASEVEPVDEKSSVSDIDSVVEIFEVYKEDVRKRSYNIEKSIYDEVFYYMEELRIFFDDRNILLEKYEISRQRIEWKIQRLLTGMKGNIDNEVCKGISLNNQELRDIIRMIPGIQKKQLMEEYAGKVFKKALDTYCRQIRNMISEFFEEVEEDVVRVIEEVEERNGRNRHQLENVDADNYREQLEEMIARADYMMIGFNILEEMLEG